MNYGRYQVVSEIGRGSMGVVYQAHDPQIDRLVALKVLRQDRVSSEDYVKRFLKEATAVGRLSHRGIVTVFDIGQDHGTIYIAMELLEGTPLDELIKQRKIDFDLIVRIGREVAGALHYAHQKGIVHRDIKPANIICSENGEIKVTDFGIAHIEDPDGQQMTQAGEILGTPVYMRPEQVSGQPVDGRSDIYSLGVILYELTTGRRPFKAGNLAALFKSITGDPVDRPASIYPETTERFSALIMRAMARDPADRYSSGEKLAGEIGTAMDTAEAAPIQSDSASGKIWAIGTLGLLLCAGVGVAYYQGYFQTVPSIIKGYIPSETIVIDEKEQEERIEPKEDTSSTVAPGGEPVESIEYISLTKEKKIISAEIKDGLSNPVKPEETVVREPTKKEPKEEIIPEVVEQDLSVDTVPDDDTGIFSNPAFEPEQKEVDVSDAAGDIQKKAEHGSLPEGWKLKEDQSLSVSVPEEPRRSVKTEQKVVVKQTTKPDVEKIRDNGEADTAKKPQKEEIIVASLIPDKEAVQLMTMLKMNSRPKGANIYIDGDYIGKTPFEFEVSAAKHEIIFQLQGHGDWKAQLDLSKGGKVPLSIRLLPN